MPKMHFHVKMIRALYASSRNSYFVKRDTERTLQICLDHNALRHYFPKQRKLLREKQSKVTIMFAKGGFGPLAQTLRNPDYFLFNNFSAKKWFVKGKVFLENILKRKLKSFDHRGQQIVLKSIERQKNVPKLSSGLRGFASRYAVATVARDLRNRAALEFSRNRRPIFSFVAVMLSTAASDEDDTVSSTIRNVFSMKMEPTSEDKNIFPTATFTDFKIGHMIGQGCNSAVYEASFQKGQIPNMQRQCSSSTDESDDLDSEGSFEVIMESDDDIEIISEEWEEKNTTFITSETDSEPKDEPLPQEVAEFDLAIKMMFNYDLESNADVIFRGMMKEITPMRVSPHLEEESMWLARNRVKLKLLPPHPNIVYMQGVFVDEVPAIKNDKQMYPAALPTRLNPDNGLGRNKTLFLVMKKYDVTLKRFLSQNNVNLNTRCSLLVQLLEGILHMTENEIAHRDLKSDNILVDLSGEQPQLVISDFGCCLAEADYGLVIPYNTSNIDKGGNAALMSPEIATAEPGRNVWLDYRKSDIWSAGTLVYEIFGEENPFYKGPMNSSTYDEKDLPPLPAAVPKPIQKLTKQLLKRDPKLRPTAKVAADIAQICILFPEWLNRNESPMMEMIRETVVLLSAAHVLKQNVKKNHLTTVFLQRVEIASLLKSLEWYHNF